MGAPIRAFPPGGSEVVSPSADLQGLSTNRPLSEQLSAARVFVTAFMEQIYHNCSQKSIPVEKISHNRLP
jgi:hypothetical protein